MTVSLTLTFADLAQAEQAIAAIRAKGISTIPAGSHGGPVCQHDQSGATASAIAGQGAVEGPEGGPTGQDAPAADPVTVASVAGLNTNSPDKFCVQASAVEDRRTASAAPITPSAATIPPRAPKAGEVFPSGLASTNSPEREPGNPEVCAISMPTRVSSGTSRPAARAHLNTEDQKSPAGESIKADCLNPHSCRIKFTTSALCWQCNAARQKAQAA
jgi:hypothetical protein